MMDSCKWRAAISCWILILSCSVATATSKDSTTVSPSTTTTPTSTNGKAGEETQEAQEQDQVAILKQINRVNNDGSYTYGYEAADGSFKIETRDVLGTVKGMFGFVDESGQLKRVTYSASNGTGFQAGPTTTEEPSPVYEQPSTSASPHTLYRPTVPSAIQSIPRVTVATSSQQTPYPHRHSAIQSIPRHRRPLTSSTTARPDVTRRPPILILRQPQVTERPYLVTERPYIVTSVPVTSTQDPVLARKVLVSRRPIIVEDIQPTPSLGKNVEESIAKPVSHQGNGLRRQLGQHDNENYGQTTQRLSPQLLRVRQTGTDDSGDVYGGGVARPIPGIPFRGLFNNNNNPTQPPRVVQEALQQGQLPYGARQRIPLGNFNNLDPRVQARILNSVDPRIQARILSSLDPRIQADIFRAAEEDLKLPVGVLPNSVDPRNPSDPRVVPVRVLDRDNYNRAEDPRLGIASSGKVPFGISNPEDPRLAQASLGSIITNANSYEADRVNPRVPIRVLNLSGSDPRIRQGYINQQDPNLVGGYNQDPGYINGYPQDPRYGAIFRQDPRLRNQYPQDPRAEGNYAQDPQRDNYPQDPNVANDYPQPQDDQALRIPLNNPRVPFDPRLGPASPSDYMMMQQLLQLLIARAQQQRLQQQQLQQQRFLQQRLLQQQQQRVQYRQRVPAAGLSPFQQALLSTLEPEAPELVDQLMNQQSNNGPQQFPANYPADENEPPYQQPYPDPQGAPYPTTRPAYDPRQYVQGYQAPYRRRFRYRQRPVYVPTPAYQDEQYYQNQQGYANYQQQDFAGISGYQQQPQRFVRPNVYRQPQAYPQQVVPTQGYQAAQPTPSYPPLQGPASYYPDLPEEYREAILLRMILASRARGQQFQIQNILQQHNQQQLRQQQSFLQQEDHVLSTSVTSTTTPASYRDSRTPAPVRNVQILNTATAATPTKRSTNATVTASVTAKRGNSPVKIQPL